MTDANTGSLFGKLRTWAIDASEGENDPVPPESPAGEDETQGTEAESESELPAGEPSRTAASGKGSRRGMFRSLFSDDDLELSSKPDSREAGGGGMVGRPSVLSPGTDSPVALDTKKNANEPAGGLQKILSLFMPAKQGEVATLSFDPGVTAIPSLDGALRDVKITYIIDAPFQYVHIEYVKAEGGLVYSVVEPQLSDDENTALRIIENAFEKLVSTNVELIDAEQRERYLHDRFYSLINIFGLKLTDPQKQRMFFHLKKNYLGYGRIDTLMKDKYIEDISCNGSNMNLYVQHRTYGSIRTNVSFGEVELNNFVLKLAQVSGRHISLLQPIRDLTLPDGSRANITLGGEVTKKGSTFTIRKFRANPISSIELMEYGSIDAQQLAYTWILMEYKRSILVSGGTATGKTTFLNVLCSFIPPEYKIVSIEDTAELNLMHPNWIQSITRVAAAESIALNRSESGGALVPKPSAPLKIGHV